MTATMLTGHPVVDAISNLHFQGNLVPHSWYQHLRYQNKRGTFMDPWACLALADIVYWYRSIEVRDEQSGHIVGYRKKFAEDKLQRSPEDFANLLGCSIKVARAALHQLEELGIIDTEVRSVRTPFGTIPSKMFIGLNSERLAEITHPITAETRESSLLPKSVRRESQMGKKQCRNGEQVVPISALPVAEMGKITIYKEDLLKDQIRDLNTDRSIDANVNFSEPEECRTEVRPAPARRKKRQISQEDQGNFWDQASEEPSVVPSVPEIQLPETPTVDAEEINSAAPKKSSKKKKKIQEASPAFVRWWGVDNSGKPIEADKPPESRLGYFYVAQRIGKQPGTRCEAWVQFRAMFGESDPGEEFWRQNELYLQQAVQQYLRSPKHDVIGFAHGCRYLKDCKYEAVAIQQPLQAEKFQVFWRSYYDQAVSLGADVGEQDIAIVAWNQLFSRTDEPEQLFSQLQEAQEFYFQIKRQAQTNSRATVEQRQVHRLNVFLVEKWTVVLDWKRRQMTRDLATSIVNKPDIPFGDTWDSQISVRDAVSIINTHWRTVALSVDDARYRKWVEQAQQIEDFEWGGAGVPSLPDWVIQKFATDLSTMVKNQLVAA